MKTIHLISIMLVLTILSACNKSDELPLADEIIENNDIVQIEEDNDVEQTDDAEEEHSETQQLNEDYIFECNFVQDEETADGWFNETEMSIMKECDENQLTTTKDIEQNLIGEWELIGHAIGWAPPISLPCAHLEITEKELVFTFENATINTVTSHTWSIVEGTRYGEKILELNVKPKTHNLNIHSFSEYYMYLDYTPQDGTMHLYQKMK